MTPEEAKERRRERDCIKSRRRRAERTKARREARAKASANTPIKPTNSKTSPLYRRRQFGHAPTMTKSEMRAAILQAMHNTAVMTP